jgi:enoyl-CoA hydratase/carnithine racemase
MSYRQIIYDVVGGVCTLTLNRPDKLNAFTGTMGDELYAAFGRANADAGVKAIVLTGAGSSFCAGVDLHALADPVEGRRIAVTPFLSRFPQENYRSAKPTIAAINGTAIGVGLTMTLSFDVRIVAAGAKLALPFTRLGLLPGLGGTYLLQRLIGRGAAMELLLSARSFTPEESLRLGLVQQVVSAAAVPETAMALARELATRDPMILASLKEGMNFGAENSLEASVENEGRLFARVRARDAAARAT